MVEHIGAGPRIVFSIGLCWYMLWNQPPLKCFETTNLGPKSGYKINVEFGSYNRARFQLWAEFRSPAAHFIATFQRHLFPTCCNWKRYLRINNGRDETALQSGFVRRARWMYGNRTRADEKAAADAPWKLKRMVASDTIFLHWEDKWPVKVWSYGSRNDRLSSHCVP